jgi:uncharacterized protein YcbK (DUF882 family)
MAMAMLTEHFDASEFLCPCGKCDGGRMDPKFIEKLERFRQMFSQPVRILSGFRCTAHNKKIGGAGGSMHVQGRAVDFVVATDADRYQALRIAFSVFGGVGVNNGSIHVDDRNAAEARCWTYYK